MLFYLALLGFFLQDAPPQGPQVDEEAFKDGFSFNVLMGGDTLEGKGFVYEIPEGAYCVSGPSMKMIAPLFGFVDTENVLGILWSSEGKGDFRDSFFFVLKHVETPVFQLEPEKDTEFFKSFVSTRHLFFGDLLVVEDVSFVQPPTYDREGNFFYVAVNYRYEDGNREIVAKKLQVLNEGAVIMSLVVLAERYRENKDLIDKLFQGLFLKDGNVGDAEAKSPPETKEVDAPNTSFSAKASEEPVSYLELLRMFDPMAIGAQQPQLETFLSSITLLHVVLFVIGLVLLSLSIWIQLKQNKDPQV